MTKLRIERKGNTFDVKGKVTSQLQLVPAGSTIIDTSDVNWSYYNARALSKDILKRAMWIDITKEDVLKNSKEKLVNKMVLANHEKVVEQWVGKVIHTFWDGENSPQGINAIIKVPKPESTFSTDFNKNIIKGLEAGVINSFSVGVEWKITPSHPDMSPIDFFLNQGKEIDGKIVRLVVDDIYDYNELSVVYEGYDANAKITNQLILAEHTLGNNEAIEINSLKDYKNYMKELSLNNTKVYELFQKGDNMVTKEKEETPKVDEEPIVEDNKEDKELDVNIDEKIEDKDVKVETEDSSEDSSSTESLQENKNMLSNDKFDNNNEIIKEKKAMGEKNNFDVLEKQIHELSKQIQQQSLTNEELKRKNINLQTKIAEIEKRKNELESSLKVTSYGTFKEKALRDGYITKSQLLMEEDGSERLESFYKSLSEDQSSLFREFVYRSALPTMLKELNNTSTVKESDVKDTMNLENKQEWLANYISELAKKNNVELKEVYSTDLYNKYFEQADIAWESKMNS